MQNNAQEYIARAQVDHAVYQADECLHENRLGKSAEKSSAVPPSRIAGAVYKTEKQCRKQYSAQGRAQTGAQAPLEKSAEEQFLGQGGHENVINEARKKNHRQLPRGKLAGSQELE